MSMFFGRQASGQYKESPNGDGDIAVVDMDSVWGPELLTEFRQRHPGKPIIALSVMEEHMEGVQVLRKPVRCQPLLDALDGCRRNLGARFMAPRAEQPIVVPAAISKPAPIANPMPPAPAPAPAPITTAEMPRPRKVPKLGGFDRVRTKISQAEELSIRQSHECCGAPGNSALDESDPRTFYQPAELLQGVVARALRDADREKMPVRLQLTGGKTLSVLPRSKVIATDVSDNMLRSLSIVRRDAAGVWGEMLAIPEFHLSYADGQTMTSIDQVMWKLALWSARGRVPAGTRLDEVVHLKRWPNLTRLLTVPQFARIAALWLHQDVSLRDTSRVLGMESRFVGAFYSACLALDLVASTRPQTVELVEQPKPSAKRGLLGRILRHLSGR
ncbi:MAG: hypothetical protein KDH88_04100 [Chromatiales bacterium]|nr:hypothetical protein [Chromatiales bacterium]